MISIFRTILQSTVQYREHSSTVSIMTAIMMTIYYLSIEFDQMTFLISGILLYGQLDASSPLRQHFLRL